MRSLSLCRLGIHIQPEERAAFSSGPSYPPQLAGSFARSINSSIVAKQEDHAMTPEEALLNILRLVDGSEDVDDIRALQILLQSIKTSAEKGLGREK
jgi:hypothetical protein